MFPALTPEQQARVAAHGRVRHVKESETVVEANAEPNKFFFVVAGQLNLFGVSEDLEEVVAVCRPGMFTGELNVLSGRRVWYAYGQPKPANSSRSIANR